jgi:hypothetical protein
MARPDEDEESLAEEDDSDISWAYPLMDEVARREGWDDPDMDSYNVYALDSGQDPGR